MDRECNCSLPSKVYVKCVHEGKFRQKCVIYELKCSMCDSICIVNSLHTSKKRMGDHLSDVQCLLKNGQKSDSFAAYFEQHFKSTTSFIYLCMYMEFMVVKQLNLIGSMKPFMEPNCNICMEERLMVLKNLYDNVSDSCI